MSKIHVLAVVASFGAHAAWAQNDTAAEEKDTSATEAVMQDVDLEAAETIFTRNCRACHGNKAQGVASYPRLSDKTPDYIVEKLETYRAGERVGPNSVLMIQNARDLSDEEIASLAAYVTTAFE